MVKEKEEWLKKMGYPVETIKLITTIDRINDIDIKEFEKFIENGSYDAKVIYNFSHLKYMTKYVIGRIRNIPDIKGVKVELKHKEDMILSVETIDEIDDKDIEDFKIDKVIIGKIGNPSATPLSIDKYRKIKAKLEEIVDGIYPNEDEAEKFKTIYTRLANMLVYDDEAAEDETLYAEENSSKSRNLENALFLGKCVCVGFAETLRQALSLVGIECYIIASESSKDDISHAYNIVKINDNYYNADLTWDLENIRNKKTPKYCLKNDEDFRKTNKEKICYHMPRTDMAQCMEECTEESLEIYPEFSSNSLWEQVKLLGKTVSQGVKTFGLVGLIKRINQERKRDTVEPIMLEEGKNEEGFKQRIQKGTPSMEKQNDTAQDSANKEKIEHADEIEK